MRIGFRFLIKTIALPLAVILCFAASAAGPVIAPGEYLDRIFAGAVPESETVWMSGETKAIATKILGHKPDFLRLRYWRKDAMTVWVIDEIGKTEPITFGLVIEDDVIKSAEVLAFRESRGWEIQHEFFLNQFQGIALDSDRNLDRPIDGISGATLSVRAITRVSRLVLYLSQTLSS
jgi:hypothetical protein